jgi:hypothetical protein
MAATAAQL